MAVTPFSWGHSLRLALAPAREAALRPAAERPLVLLSGWMGATDKQLRRYKQLYHDCGIDIMSFAAGPSHVLRPEKAIALVEGNMRAVMQELEGDPDRRIIYHGFSMSGYLWGLCLLAMREKPEEFGPFRRALGAQIMDSPPDYEGIASGVAQSMGYGGLTQAVITRTIDMYLHCTRDTAGVHHRASSRTFHDNYLLVPSLWYYSKADPVARWDRCDEVIRKWRAKGIDVDAVVFEDTPHIQHLRYQQEQYVRALHAFLSKNRLMPPPAAGA